MANILPRRTTETSLATFPSGSSYPSVFGRFEPFRWMEDWGRWDPLRNVTPGYPTSEVAFSPDFEIEETSDRYVLKGDLPGVAESDLDISMSGNRLTISGKRHAEKKEEGVNYYCYERSYGSFSRSFTLPSDADVEQVKADLNNGVLTLEVHKTAEAQPRRIALGSGDSRKAKGARA